MLGTQWVDFRTGRVKTLQALAAHLTNKANADVRYGMQISPTGFNTANGFPRRVIFVLGSCYLILVHPPRTPLGTAIENMCTHLQTGFHDLRNL